MGERRLGSSLTVATVTVLVQAACLDALHDP